MKNQVSVQEQKEFDAVQCEGLCHNAVEGFREKVLTIIVEEIVLAQTTESGKTSRLTSAYLRIKDIL